MVGIGILGAAENQFGMPTVSYQLPTFEKENAGCLPEQIDPVRHQEGCAQALACPPENRIVDKRFTFRLDRRGRFIKQQNPRSCKEGTGEA